MRKIDLLKNFKRKSPVENTVNILVSAIFFVVAASYVYIFVWAFIAGAKTHTEIVMDPFGLPEKWHWEHYLEVFKTLKVNGSDFWDMLFNSVWLVGGTALLQSFSVCVTGYIFAQYEFKGREFLFKTVLFIMIIPIYGSLPATYKLIYGLGINDSPLYLISQIGGFSANMMITYGFFKGVPKAYREAVYIDGGSDFKAFTTIGLPMGKNILIAYFLLNFIMQWNNYETPLLYFNNMPTLSLGLHAFQQEIQYAANYPAYFAGALIAMLPILLIFVFFADKLMGQMYSGGLKG